jgi:hypothetical protein
LIPHVADFRMGVVFEHSSGFERTKKVLGRSLAFFAIEPTLVVFRVKDGRHPVVYRSQDRIGGHRDNCITLKPLTKYTARRGEAMGTSEVMQMLEYAI